MSNQTIRYSGVTCNAYLCTLLILAVDKCHLTLNHLFIEVLIGVDCFMAVSITPSSLIVHTEILLHACGLYESLTPTITGLVL